MHLPFLHGTLLLMNPNSTPPQPPQHGPDREFTKEALEKKFSFAFTRGQLIMLVNVLRPIQLPIGDLRNKILVEVLDQIERTAIQSITDDDYVKPEKPKGAEKPLPSNGVATN